MTLIHLGDDSLSKNSGNVLRGDGTSLEALVHFFLGVRGFR